jgi:hypothetical protein
MAPTPIYPAIAVLRKAIFEALDPLTTAGVYWVQAAQGAALPFVIFFSQDGGGQAEKTIGNLSWSGLVTVKALANSQSAAETLMGATAPGMAAPTAAGYTISTNYQRPIVIPPVDGVWQCGHLWRVFIATA